MSRSVAFRWLLFPLLVAIAACVPELKPHPHTTPRPAATTTRPASPSSFAAPSTTTALSTGAATIIVRVQTDVNAERLATILESAPSLRLTLIFPSNYFKDARATAATPRFVALQQAGRLEVALSLDNEPILPLLASIKRIPEAQRGRVAFAWPDDIGHQMARGSAAYQRRWIQLPSGFYPPYQAVSSEVMDAARKFRLNWVLGSGLPTGGVRFYGTTALLVPAAAPALGADEMGTPAGADKLISWAMSQPFAFLDFSSTTTAGAAQTLFFERLAAAAKDPQRAWSTAVTFVSGLKDEHALPTNVDPMARDYSAWVATPEQRRAWNALNEARASIERYKNSGRANLQRLDAATEEMSGAESGNFLLALGGDTTDENGERNFIATVSNVHRLTENPVPPYLVNLFSDRSLQKAVPVHGADLDRPFFIPGDHVLTWNDPAGDDNGAGKFVYPIGRYTKGQFDLKEFSVAWTDTDVTFSIACGAATPTPPTTVLPLADIYVDINRLPGAGSTAVLPRRGDGYVERDAAWEYALAVSPAGAGLYQSTGGNASRLLHVLSVTRNGPGFQVVVPRSTLRGEPNAWRLSVGIGGTDVRRGDEEPVPVPVLPTAGDRHFGGATPGRPVVTYLDLLADTVDEQNQRIGAYESGQRVTLPYVEGETQ